MHQLTLRVPDSLNAALKAHAARRGESVNAYASAVLGAAVDPDLADDTTERLRGRLARAGLLAETPGAGRVRPSAERVAAARAQAGTGEPLSKLVREGRG